MAKHLHDPHRNALGVAVLRAGPSQLLEILDRTHAVGRPLRGVFIAQAIEIEIDPTCDFDTPCDRIGRAAIELFDLVQ